MPPPWLAGLSLVLVVSLLLLASRERARNDKRTEELEGANKLLADTNALLKDHIAWRKKNEKERLKFIEELEARNAEMERFTYTVSHDLKSPLITIRGFLGLLEKDAMTGDLDRMKADMKRIRGAVGQMSRLLDELLELSRVGRLSNAPQAVRVGELARLAVEIVAGRIESQGVEIEIAEDFPSAFGDRPRLLEVMQNLIDNAVKFMGEAEKPRVEIGWKRQDGEVVYYVRDNGIGIEEPYRERVFGLFERLDHGYEGTGIGLALVKRIIEVHGGRIWIESEGAGHGSTFLFTVPSEKGAA